MEQKIEENMINDTTAPENVVKRQQIEVVVGGGSNSVKETLEVLNSAINHDESITEENLDSLNSAVESMKINIGGKELTLEDVGIISSINASLNDLYRLQGVAETDLPTPNPIFVDPKEIKYREKMKNPDRKKSGTYTLNPGTFKIDFEKTKVFIPDLSAMGGSQLHEVFQYVVNTYGDKYYIPGIEYWKWIVENPDKIDAIEPRLKDRNYYYFLGSSLCSHSGDWCVIGASWSAGGFYCDITYLPEWLPGDQVVLLEK